MLTCEHGNKYHVCKHVCVHQVAKKIAEPQYRISTCCRGPLLPKGNHFKFLNITGHYGYVANTWHTREHKKIYLNKQILGS